MRLFCFHHAGSGGMAFKAWVKALRPAFKVIPVEVADRQRFATLRQLVDEVNDQLGSSLDEPHMFFGHSFGALVAYRLVRARGAGFSGAAGGVLVRVPPTALPQPLHAWMNSTTTSSRRSCPAWAGCRRTNPVAQSARASPHCRSKRLPAVHDGRGRRHRGTVLPDSCLRR